jgi:uncharacterized Ntn-hydrolase superfamily protein
MTHSIAARRVRTGMLGSVVTTSAIAVGNRCQFARPGVGAVLTQHCTDPRLGPLGLEFLKLGLTAQATIAALVASTAHHGWRQLAVIDAKGAHDSGHNIGSIHAGAWSGLRGDCQRRRSAEVPTAMVRAFEQAAGRPPVRRAEGRHDADGEFKQVTSAGLLVVNAHALPYVDLRADDHPDPIAEITRLWALYAPVADTYLRRVLEPDSPEANMWAIDRGGGNGRCWPPLHGQARLERFCKPHRRNDMTAASRALAVGENLRRRRWPTSRHLSHGCTQCPASLN